MHRAGRGSRFHLPGVPARRVQARAARSRSRHPRARIAAADGRSAMMGIRTSAQRELAWLGRRGLLCMLLAVSAWACSDETKGEGGTAPEATSGGEAESSGLAKKMPAAAAPAAAAGQPA